MVVRVVVVVVEVAVDRCSGFESVGSDSDSGSGSGSGWVVVVVGGLWGCVWCPVSLRIKQGQKFETDVFTSSDDEVLARTPTPPHYQHRVSPGVSGCSGDGIWGLGS